MRTTAGVMLLSALLSVGCGSTVAPALRGNGQPFEGTTGLGPASTSGSSAVPGSSGQLPAIHSTGAPSRGTTGTGGTSGPAGATGPTGALPPGAIKDRSPVTVGMVLTDTGNAAALGISLGNTFTERALDEALVRALNKRGGLAGRRIVPVYAKTDTGSANWETDFAAACATFTQDHKVAAVIGFVFNYDAAFERCLAKRDLPHLNTGFNIPDDSELRPYPLHRALEVPTVGRRSLAKLDGALATGVLTSRSKLGILRDTCPGTPRSYDQVVVPFARRHGLNLAKTVSFNCVQGNAGSGNAVSAIQSAVLAFNSAGVDRIMVHGVSEAGPILMFTSAAESQGYHPQYLVSSLAQLAALGGEIPPGQVKNIHAFGWLPTQDVSPSRYPPYNTSQRTCLALLKSEGLVPSSATDYFGAFEMCESFFLYKRALELTGGNSAGSAVVQAIDSLGTSFQSSTNLGGTSRYGPGRADAVLSARPLDYDGSCSCFVYFGHARPIPD